MIFNTLVGLNRLKSFFPDNFDIVKECLDSDISTIRLVHLKRYPDNISSMIHEAVRSRIRKAFQQKFGLVLAYYDKKDDSICFNADLDKTKVANELNRQLGIDVKPSEIYVWVFYHEIGHKRALDESGADKYANEKFKAWKTGAGN